MDNNPNEGYFQPSLGSLTGFDQFVKPDGEIELATTGWSLEQIRKFLLNENGANFASEEWVLLLNEAIQEHIQDLDNPHRVTLEQVTPDFVAGVLENLTTGTVPEGVPFVSFDSSCPLPLGNVFPATYNTTNLYRVTETGAFIDPTTETNIMGVDCINGEPALPLFPPIVNTVPADWFSQPTTPINTTIEERSGDDLFYPFQFYAVSETIGNHRSGVSLPSQQVNGDVVTATFFIASTAAAGSLLIYQKGDPSKTMLVDLETGESNTNSNAVIGKTVVYHNEVIKVSFSFVVTAGSAGNVDIVHLDPNTTVPVRNGDDGRIIFHIAHPLISKSSLDHPILINPAVPASTSSFGFHQIKLGTPAFLSEALVTIALDMMPMLDGAISVNPVILNVGPLKFTRDEKNVYVMLADTVLFTSKILEGLNVFTLSYSNTKLIFKDLATKRKTINAQFPSLELTMLRLDPCYGYMRHMAIYSHCDRTKCVEFLTNG